MDEARGFLTQFLFIGCPDKQTYNYHSQANHTMYNVLDYRITQRTAKLALMSIVIDSSACLESSRSMQRK
jgi:hypothetical protein